MNGNKAILDTNVIILASKKQIDNLGTFDDSKGYDFQIFNDNRKR